MTDIKNEIIEALLTRQRKDNSWWSDEDDTELIKELSPQIDYSIYTLNREDSYLGRFTAIACKHGLIAYAINNCTELSKLEQEFPNLFDEFIKENLVNPNVDKEFIEAVNQFVEEVKHENPVHKS